MYCHVCQKEHDSITGLCHAVNMSPQDQKPKIIYEIYLGEWVLCGADYVWIYRKQPIYALENI